MSDFRKDVFFANGGSDHHTAEQNREMTEWQDSEITRLQEQAVELGAEIESLRERLRWRTGKDGFPSEDGAYLVEFYLDQGGGHGHNETLLCHFDEKTGGLIKPDFAGVGFPSILTYLPVPQE